MQVWNGSNWHETDLPERSDDVRSPEKTGSDGLMVKPTRMTRFGHRRRFDLSRARWRFAALTV
jgi:hypothetical protein